MMDLNTCGGPSLVMLLLFYWSLGAIAVGGYSTGDFCTASDTGQPGVIVRLKNGYPHCCQNKSCPPGTFPQVCNNVSSQSSSCEPCPEETYRAYPSKTADGTRAQCTAKRTCFPFKGLMVVSNGSKTEDRVCRCRLEEGYHSPDVLDNPTECTGADECPEGRELDLHSGECKHCKPGSFKKKGLGLCKYWQDCEAMNRRLVKYGTKTSDSVCGEVIKSTTTLKEFPDRDPTTMPTAEPYIEPSTENDSSSPLAVIFGSIGGVILLLLLVLCCFCCCKRCRCGHLRKKVQSLITKTSGNCSDTLGCQSSMQSSFMDSSSSKEDSPSNSDVKLTIVEPPGDLQEDVGEGDGLLKEEKPACATSSQNGTECVPPGDLQGSSVAQQPTVHNYFHFKGPVNMLAVSSSVNVPPPSDSDNHLEEQGEVKYSVEEYDVQDRKNDEKEQNEKKC